MSNRPTLLNSCASAATAAEARYRVAGTAETQVRATRVVALDDGATTVVRRLAARPWRGARFYAGLPPLPTDPDRAVADILLRSVDGSESRLSEELSGADLAVMVATADGGARAASAIGSACTWRGIMTAGLVIGSDGQARAAASALRPHARVLVVSSDEDDVSEVLTALRA